MFDPMDINAAFSDFYRTLYTAGSSGSSEDLLNFLNEISLPSISEDTRAFLNAPFSKEEIWQSIQSMPTGKAPGPDGFPLGFYKQFWPELCPILMQAINSTLDSNSMPESWSLAVISLLLKKGKDPVNCSSYRPISLLNVDYKIIAKSNL